MLGYALTASMGDLFIGLLIVLGALVVRLGPLVYMEIRYGGEETEMALAPGVDDAWSGLPLKWVPPRAESDLGSERKAA